MATTTNDGSGFSAVSGGTWSSTANAFDGSATTFTSLTTTTAGAHVFDITGYGFATPVGSGDTLNSVVVRVYQYVNNAARWNNPTVQAYDGATAIGSATTLTESTSSTNFDDVTITGITLAQIRSANFKVRFTASKNGTQSATQNFGAAEVTVDYSPPAAAQTLVASGISGTPSVATPVGKSAATASVTAVAGTSSVGAVTLKAPTTVAAAGIEGTATVPHPTVSQTIPPQALVVGGIANSATVDLPHVNVQQFRDITARTVFPLGPPILTVQTLVAVPIEQTPTFGHNVFLIPTATVQASGITASPTVSTPSVDTAVSVTAVPIDQTPSFAHNIFLIPTATVVAGGISGSASAATPAVATAATVAAVGISSASSVDDPSIVQTGPPQTLTVAGITLSPTVGDPNSLLSAVLAVPDISGSVAVRTPSVQSVLRRIKRNTVEHVYTYRMPAARYGIDTQGTIILKDGVIVVNEYPDTLTLDTADAYYLGGREYALTQAEYDAIVSAGRPDLVEIV